MSAVAGTAEPEYGTEAIHPITTSVDSEIPIRDATTEEMKWQSPTHTNVETQTFYFNCFKTGYMGFAQIIHSNIVGLHTTAQFTFKCFHKDSPDEFTWTSTKLEDFKIENGVSFHAKNLNVELIEDDTYRIQSFVNPESLVDITMKRVVPGVIFGENGTTYYGYKKDEPWGTMRHVFWPRSDVAGSIKLQKMVSEGEYELVKDLEIKGKSMFVMALQGMKPHHAAATWNFCHYTSERYSAVMMEFTTPPSYGRTKVSVAIVSDDNEVLFGSVKNECTHENAQSDEVGWPVPRGETFHFQGVHQGKPASVKISGELTKLSERVDVMAEIPQFVKNIVSGVAGTKPYIYQFCNEFKFSLDVDEKHIDDEGVCYTEATFITEI